MFFARLSEVPRTTSFRTALIFLSLFICSFLALFGYIYWQTTGYLLNDVDAELNRTIESLSQQPMQIRLKEMLDHSINDRNNLAPSTLFNASGKPIVGPMKSVPAFGSFDQPYELSWSASGSHNRPVRFIVHRLDDSSTLVAAEDIHDIREFHELLMNALLSGGSLLILVGLIGAVALGYSARRRLDGLTRSIRHIVEGDLGRRLPVRGNGDDIDRLSEVVNGMLDAIERLMGELKGVCDDIAHDLRTPLTRLIGGLERARRHKLSEAEYVEALDEALDEAKGLMQTFRALLRISQIEAGARRSQFSIVDLNRIAADVSELFEPLAEERDINLSLVAAPHPACISGDPQLLFDATCNLLDNALKFVPNHGRVEVRVIADASRSGLSISDNGPGIAAEEREAVFRRLYRGDASRNKPGNGLGLSMVSAVARLHDMSLEVHDALPGCRMEIIGKAVNS
ncbi:sensor histidine kinase [Pseudomonas sp. YQ_5]|uniref:sensor histidine kinase n=1 Tax=Pseudomonas sp. YQ_5 TaxID=3367229 RepID=UPI00370C652F